jgi:hypothetical protein
MCLKLWDIGWMEFDFNLLYYGVYKIPKNVII